MVEELAIVAVLVLALYGVADLIERLVFRLLFGKGEDQYLLVPVTESEETAEYAVRRLTATCRFFPPCHRVVPLVVSDTPSMAIQNMCENIGVKWCSAQNMNEFLHSSLQRSKKDL
jgi:hypothetical protein